MWCVSQTEEILILVLCGAGVNSFRINSTKSVADVCPMDDLDLDLRLRNDKYTQQCASRELERMQYLVRVCRLIVHLIVEACAYWVNIIMTLMRFIIETTDEGIRSVTIELMFWFDKLWLLITSMLTKIADLMFHVVFDNGAGEKMLQMAEEVCEAANRIWDWIQGVKKLLGEGLANMFRGASSAVHSICIPTLACIPRVKVFDDIADTLSAWASKREAYLNCKFDDPFKNENPSGANPVATRCSAEYIPSVDDSNALSCSRSDTCRRSEIYFGGDGTGTRTMPIVCSQCNHQTDITVSTYGCDILTKQCTCNRIPRLRTSCTTNSECWLPDAMCNKVSDFSTGSSSGGMECSRCGTPEPVCLITDGRNDIGTCSCLMQVLHACSPCCTGVFTRYILTTMFHLHNPLVMY